MSFPEIDPAEMLEEDHTRWDPTGLFTFHEHRKKMNIEPRIEPDCTGSILLEAESLVNGDRAKAYGTPRENWTRIRNLCHATGRPGLATVTAEDLAILMILVKVARDTASPKRDNTVDIAGYAFVLDQVRGS